MDHTASISRSAVIQDTSGRRSSVSIPQEVLTKTRWQLDDFDVGRKIGEGRFGKIYLARERTTKCAVVLKCLSKEAIVVHDMKHQIQREIELHMFCKHRHIVRMLAYFWDEDRIFLVLDYCEGGDLDRKLNGMPGRRLPTAEVRLWTKQLVMAVAYLHHHRLLHRDIKPENILLKKNNVKLADFTWAVFLPDESNNATRRRQTLCGTLDYLSPQVLDAQQDGYDEATDMWSVGAVVFEMLYGYPPFETSEVRTTCDCIRSGTIQYRNNDALNVVLPPFVSSFLAGLLCTDPRKRLTAEQALQHPFLTGSADEAAAQMSQLKPAGLTLLDESRRLQFSNISVSANTSVVQGALGTTASVPTTDSTASTRIGHDDPDEPTTVRSSAQQQQQHEEESARTRAVLCTSVERALTLDFEHDEQHTSAGNSRSMMHTTNTLLPRQHHSHSQQQQQQQQQHPTIGITEEVDPINDLTAIADCTADLSIAGGYGL